MANDKQPTDKQIMEAAGRARQHAHAPYSNYSVGAALVDERGQIHIGCNVENETYPLGTCAEAGAIAAMVVAGGTRIQTIVVAGGFDDLATCTPCGGCRQKIAEFADANTRILMIDETGDWATYSIDALLPASFHMPG